MKTILKILILGALFLLLLYLFMSLFFSEELQDMQDEFLHSSATMVKDTDKQLAIGFSALGDSFEPTHFDSDTRNLTLNVYEGLIGTDRNLQIEPALAVSWGRLSDVLWEFNLRQSVMFHDGSVFDAEDVLESFERALKSEKSDLTDILSTIEKVDKIDNFTIHIKTKDPDPLLINRVATVLVFPSEKTNLDIPVGTGPYRYFRKEGSDIEFRKFDEYWGKGASYTILLLREIPNRFNRLDAITDGDIQLLANVPPGFAKDLSESQMVTITSLPSLEVNFLIFNLDSELFSDQRIREAVSLSFDRDAFVNFSLGFARPAYQYVSNGIFGYNPDLPKVQQDIVKAKALVREYDPFKRPSFTIDMSQGTEILGEYIKIQLDEIDMVVNINVLPWNELREKILNKESDIYFLGWRSEIGDASDFYENIIYSQGGLNGGGYENKKVDQLIELSSQNLNQKKRIEQLHEIMRIITQEDIVGVPLFESELIYGIRAGVQFKPRLDGYVLGVEIT